MLQTAHIEQHFTGSARVCDVVIGMSDGLTVPFALAAGPSGAIDSTSVVITAGLAEVAAGSIAMKPYSRSWILLLACALLAAAGCGIGQLSRNQAQGILQKAGFFDKLQPGGLLLRLQEVTGVKNIDKASAEAQFRWVAESQDAPECRLELNSSVAFRRFESGWDLDPADFVKTIQSAIEGAVNSGTAERYVRLISLAEGDFSARRGRYASLEEMMEINIIPTGLSIKDNGFEISGYFFKLTTSHNNFTLTSRSLVITEKAPAYFADSSGGIRISTKGPVNAKSPFLK